MDVLIAPHMERCIGCLLCVLVASRSEGQRSINNSLIRIIPKDGGFVAEIDAGQAAKAQIAAICPRNCLEITVA